MESILKGAIRPICRWSSRPTSSWWEPEDRQALGLDVRAGTVCFKLILLTALAVSKVSGASPR